MNSEALRLLDLVVSAHDAKLEYVFSVRLSKLRALLSAQERSLWGVVANAGHKSINRGRQPRWVRVMEATSQGSTAARELCVRFGFDADELVPVTAKEQAARELAKQEAK
jgi:hypothetical protein